MIRFLALGAPLDHRGVGFDHEFDPKVLDNGPRDLVLDIKGVHHFHVFELSGPKLEAVLDVDELGCDTGAPVGHADGALEHGVDREHLADFTDVEASVFEPKDGAAADDA